MTNLTSLPSAANFSDALRLMGHPFQTLRGNFRCPFPNAHLCGPAYPVRCYSGATWAVENAVEEAPAGSILIMDGGGYPHAVLMGGLLSLRAAQRGILGAVIDGAIRDLPDLIKEQWPVFATHHTPAGGTFAQMGDWGKPISCAGVCVQAGDFIIADDDGVVVIPSTLLEETRKQAQAIEEKERFLDQALREGRSLSEAVALWKLSSEK